MHRAPRAPAARAPRLVAALLCLAAAASGAGAGEPTVEERVRSLVGTQIGTRALPAAVAAAARIEIELGRIDPRLKLAPCSRIEPRWPAQARAWGRTQVALRCVEGERHWQVYLPLVVKVLAPAWVPARALPAGTVLAREDLIQTEVDWAAAAQPPHAAAEDLVGRTLSRAVAAGQAVRTDDLRLRQWFASGETVQVVARGQGFTVSGAGQALGPGIEGQPVRVRTESGRVLAGTAVGERRVEVLL